MPSVFGIFIVFIAVLTWAISSIGYKAAMGSEGTVERDPIASLAIRIIIVGIITGALALIFGDLHALVNLTGDAEINYWLVTVLSALLTLVGDITYFKAFRYVDSSRVYPLINTQTLFTFPFAFWFFGEVIPGLMWLAAILMMAGVFFVGKDDAQDVGMEGLDPKIRRKNTQKGILLSIATGFFFGTQYLALNMQNRIYYGIMENNLTRIALYAIMLWGYILCTRKHIPVLKTAADREIMKAYVMTGLFGALSFGIGDAIYQIGATQNGNALSIVIASSAPIFNQILAIIFLKEKFRPHFLIGVLCIVLGNILVIF